MARCAGLALLAALAMAGCAKPEKVAQGQADGASPQATLSLVGPSDVVAGRRFVVGVELSVPAGWHTYWLNPGETGMAPEFRWTLPDGVKPVAIHFPVPERFEDSGIVSIGYEQTVRLLAEFEAEPTLAAASVDIGVVADWMVCRDICLPVVSKAQVTLPVVAAGPDAAAAEDRFSADRAELPKPAKGWQVSVARDGGFLRVRVVPADANAAAGESWARANLFPVRRGALDLAATPVWARDGGAWMAVVPLGPGAPAAGERFEAVLAFEESGTGWLVGADVTAR